MSQTETRDEERWFRYFEELLLIKGLSPEQAAPHIGISSRQLRRWIAGKARPRGPHFKTFLEGLRRLEQHVPDRFVYDSETKKVRAAAWGSPEEAGKEERPEDKELEAFLVELQDKVDPLERELILFASDYWTGFREIALLARKYGMRLPMFAKSE